MVDRSVEASGDAIWPRGRPAATHLRVLLARLYRAAGREATVRALAVMAAQPRAYARLKRSLLMGREFTVVIERDEDGHLVASVRASSPASSRRRKR